ncbi:hypothetical protein AXF42_Ash016121 [Apostasia shenzhenica]|uniref:Uncharacterized protein n=1 Tax=Apostasia shenzhenica TaxID=1088818 RepID=A0A2I0B3G7_9ASPA|nr:hypothetical protein AXF42_Ash016121 [Apostasia shenzhenica]
MAEMSVSDAKRLWSIIWHGEDLVYKKRRWLMQMALTDTGEVRLKKFKKPKLLNKLFLPESFVRSDEVSSEAVKLNVEKSCRSSGDTEKAFCGYDNQFLLSDKHQLECYFFTLSNLKKFHSAIDLLSNKSLCFLAQLVTKNKISFERSRSKLKEVIKDHFSHRLLASGDLASLAQLQELHEILENPSHLGGKQSILMATASSSPLTSISMALELLDSMPLRALTAVNRKLLGKKWVPRFPPSKPGYQKKHLVNMIKARCGKLTGAVHNDSCMPQELVKALSVIYLFFQHKNACYDTLMPKFYFSTETVRRQSDILKALSYLSELTSNQLKDLHSILGIKLENDATSFENDLKHYLLQCLFECDELDVPVEVSDVLGIINKNPISSQLGICSEETIKEESEAVLNVSCQLMKIWSKLPSDISPDDNASLGLESDGDTQSIDFELTESGYCSTFVKHEHQQKEVFCINDEVETSGDSVPAAYCGCGNNSSGDVSPLEASMKLGSLVELKEKQIDKQDSQSNFKELMENFLPSPHQVLVDSRDIPINELCDVIGFVSYKLIGNMLDKFLRVEGHDIDVKTRHRKKGEAFRTKGFQGIEGPFRCSLVLINNFPFID